MNGKIKALVASIEAVVNDNSVAWEDKVLMIKAITDNDSNSHTNLEEFLSWFSKQDY